MTRKDFEFIAKVLADSAPLTTDPSPIAIATWRFVAETFANRLLDTNERFNRGKFLKACGVI